ncbi:hypothetical protein CSV75_03650 [Sporosarcina sp. P18a]|uniref:DUF2922 domain-containing protein n=1 Tax=unclassified Sporosarcina TaxID=2647733 RepID=UPI000C17026E|nr:MULTISPECIES: DUF2922 domain-containing protein [unclassified Sporosarcina]PIC69385.1 hypothetical protein CSV77_13925 [Sporosarcina sp. P16b]PIC80890.1 hypothetical protein CSV75_03650 [Sporosarcina sp. P18a]PID01380.1 hypothetical protein CSV67_14375 [Sporosarcina sp. P2]PID15119.1 hypothetical protein CSV63_10055 [Sporosarcina sp. P34]PID25103.1 hypothetical protein CSV60_05590 [Sporosarcina sp. P7]
MAKVLELTFLTAANKPVTLTVDEPDEDITQGQVEAVMQQVIQSNIFLIEESPLATIKGARIVARDTRNIVSR